jgi:hypothetical protein
MSAVDFLAGHPLEPGARFDASSSFVTDRGATGTKR